MSVAKHLGLDDSNSEVLALARQRWSTWQAEHTALRCVDDLMDLPAYVRKAERDEADAMLLALAQLSSPEGGDDVAATGVLAWLLLPGVSLLAARMGTLTPTIDEILAGQLWVEARTFPWQRGHRVAANILMNTRKSVMRDLGVGDAAEGSWARCAPTDPSEIGSDMVADPIEIPPERELAELLEWACRSGIMTPAERGLLIDVAESADRRGVRSGRGYAGLLGEAVCSEVAERRGVSPITVRRRAKRLVQTLRTSATCATEKVPA